MQESQQSQNERHLLLNMALIILETIFSFILKNDNVTRLQAKGFVQRRTVVKISSYLPLFEVYVQFSDRGLLFEREIPLNQTVEIDIGLNLSDLIKIFVFGNASSVELMRIDGQSQAVEEFRDLILNFSVPRLIAEWQQWLMPREHIDPSLGTANHKRIAPFLDKIEKQRTEIRDLKMKLAQTNYRLLHAGQQQQRVIWSLIVVSLILFISLIVQFFVN